MEGLEHLKQLVEHFITLARSRDGHVGQNSVHSASYSGETRLFVIEIKVTLLLRQVSGIK